MKGAHIDRPCSDTSFVQFHNRDARDRVLQVILEKKLPATSSVGATLVVGRMPSATVRHRNWAMRKSEELIRARMVQGGVSGEVEFDKPKEKRCIIVNGFVAFIQLPSDEAGSFVGDFDDLALP